MTVTDPSCDESRVEQFHCTSVLLGTIFFKDERVLGSIVVSIPACHAGDRGSIPRRGGYFFLIEGGTKRPGPLTLNKRGCKWPRPEAVDVS